MTAKEALREWVERLSEEEAQAKLPWVTASPPDFRPASPEVMALFRRALADSDAGRTITDDEFSRRHGLED